MPAACEKQSGNGDGASRTLVNDTPVRPYRHQRLHLVNLPQRVIRIERPLLANGGMLGFLWLINR